MNGTERRKKIISILDKSEKAVSGISLARQCDVSRQVIVQDIALLRAQGHDILSTNQGYLIQEKQKVSRVFKVSHTEKEAQDELELFIDYGVLVKDVFVYHKVYGILRAELNIKSRLDIMNFMEDIRSGKSSLLLNVTSGFHYHTVMADSEKILDIVQEKLQERGYLAQLQDYEPVNFWEDKKDD